jgi:predicted ribosomally synthesized peptide with nif11-like leader
MATQRAKEFIQAVANNAEFKQQLELAKTREERRAIIDAAGFGDVSKEEILEATKSPNAIGQLTNSEVEAIGELSDEELEAVAGGETTLWISAIVIALVA